MRQLSFYLGVMLALVFAGAAVSCKAKKSKPSGATQQEQQSPSLRESEQQGRIAQNNRGQAEPNLANDWQDLERLQFETLEKTKSRWAYRSKWRLYYRTILQNGRQLESSSQIAKQNGQVHCELVFRTLFFPWRRRLNKGEILTPTKATTRWNNSIDFLGGANATVEFRDGRLRRIECTKHGERRINRADLAHAVGGFFRLSEF